MILLWGVPGDGPLDAVRTALDSLRADVLFFDQRESHRYDAVTRAGPAGLSLRLRGESPKDDVDFDFIRAAYLRPIETERALPNAHSGNPDVRIRAENVDRSIVEWSDLADALVANPLATMAPNNSKPYQSRLIAGYGFEVPATLVTTDPGAVEAFARRYGRIIYKSISGVRSIVNILDDTSIGRIGDVTNAPTQFQEYVPGLDIRVHVIGKEIHATSVTSEAHDYRYASHSGNGVSLECLTLPPGIADKCRDMAAGMGLSIAGIDFRLTPDGRWVCFEVNPSPAFVYYQEATGQPISEAIAHLLVQADT